MFLVQMMITRTVATEGIYACPMGYVICSNRQDLRYPAQAVRILAGVHVAHINSVVSTYPKRDPDPTPLHQSTAKQALMY